MQTPILRIETLTSPPVTIQNTQVHVRSQLVQLRLPTVNGAVIWNRPLDVVLRTLDDKEKIVPIPDGTRTAVLTLAGLCFTAMFAFIFLRRKRRNLERKLTHGRNLNP